MNNIVTATESTPLPTEVEYLQELDRERQWLSNPTPEIAASIFAGHTRLFTHYRVEIQFRAKVMGGIPKDPKVIEAWLRTKTGVTAEREVTQMMRRTLEQQGLEVASDATIDDMISASEAVAGIKSTNGFLFDANGLYLPGRYVKAMLKEVTNVLWAGDRWGPTRKGPKNYLAERVFVLEDEIYLGRMAPDGIDMVIGHVDGPQGKRSTLGYHEFVERGSCVFTVMSLNDCITPDQWGDIFEVSQEEGLGALRSQQHGRFNVVDIARVHRPAKETFVIRDDLDS